MVLIRRVLLVSVASLIYINGILQSSVFIFPIYIRAKIACVVIKNIRKSLLLTSGAGPIAESITFRSFLKRNFFEVTCFKLVHI